MQPNYWQEDIPVAITVTDKDGTIIEMNKKAAAIFENSGGKHLIGRNVKDCHPEHTHAKIDQISQSDQPNIYTIQKGGKRKMIFQTAYFHDGNYNGLVEISFEIPDEIPNFNRD
ncbi:MAG TPA: diguanylate cyclase [Anaerolineaceae bacterium]|uniref:PAS fold domain protein n=1 Tax=Anaerolinea thermophila TaxID=167964 RepID=A0A101FY24_9CHLR|nr:MAG: PAS fold domain protein [Anaerolinea thermophila]HAF62172.1 diguanylate cyclase [Anaerolineaceae bacterium]